MAETDSAIPYQAYKSKRHSRKLTPTSSPSRPNSVVYGALEKEIDVDFPFLDDSAPQTPASLVLLGSAPTTPVIVLEPAPSPVVAEAQSSQPAPELTIAPPSPSASLPDVPPSSSSSSPASPAASPVRQASPLPSASTSQSPATAPPTKRASTFRRVPRASRPPIPPSPLSPQSHVRHPSTSSIVPPSAPSSRPASMVVDPGATLTSFSSILTPSTYERPVPEPQVRQPEPVTPPTRTTSLQALASTPPSRTTSLQALPVSTPPTLPPPPARATSLVASSPRPTTTATSSASRPRPSAPYRPGFQPKGVYRPRTDEFVTLRKLARDGDPTFGHQKRVEREKLERRLEKIIALHFSPGGRKSKPQRPVENRRASSFFEFDLNDLKRMSNNPGGLLKGVLAPGSKDDIRSSEQRITPWEEDSTVSACPICSTSFHPLTNRKHHCRLCGKIICSLPIKRPHRPAPCSILFVVDPKTRRIEEVGEGVDYGVRKRRNASIGSTNAMNEQVNQMPDDEAEKFLKGVRICKDCRPVLLRQQYRQETVGTPTFAKLYDAFLIIEKELEDSLPQFQELLLSLNHDDHPTKEATQARKRLLEIFGQYDALSKRIRYLPCATGGSQDRVQAAILTRASIFLQQHMFPLQSLPKAKSKTPATTTKSAGDIDFVDPDSEIAKTLQPLLEQEALLESFVEEATASRKFEDAKTLRVNLKEIRDEIERIVGEAEAGGKGLQKK